MCYCPAPTPSQIRTSTSNERSLLSLAYRILVLIAPTMALAACSATDIPPSSGLVVDRDTQRPVSQATVLVRYSGATKARESWLHALTGLRGARCIRWMTTTDSAGRFEIPASTVNAHFGSPTIQFVVYDDRFRQRLGGLIVRADNSMDRTLEVWAEPNAERYDSASGEAVADQDGASRGGQINRYDYLDRWIALSGLTDGCDYDPDRDQIELFLLERFEDWLETAPAANRRVTRPSACNALMAFNFRTDNRGLAERFREMKLRASQTICLRDEAPLQGRSD